MKNKILLTTALFIFCLNLCFSQSYVGFHAGLNSGKFSGDSPRNFIYKGKLQYNFGIDFDVRLKDDLFLSISPGYLFSGSKLQYPYEDIEEEKKEYRDSVDLKLYMISVPLYLKIISDNEKYQFLGGLDFGFPTKVLADNSVEEKDLYDEVNNFTVSMIFGLGYRVHFTNSLMLINLGFSQGITNLANNIDDQDTYMPRVRLSTWRFSIAYMLPVGKGKNTSD